MLRQKSRARPFRRRSVFAECRRRGFGSLKTRRWTSARWMPGPPIWRVCCWSNLRWLTATTGLSFLLSWTVGSLYRTRSLVITDTFGVRTLIKSSSELGAPHSLWRMFQHSYTRGSGFTVPASNLFFLPPSLLKSMESRPIEEVLFLRDEMANLAWAVERSD